MKSNVKQMGIYIKKTYPIIKPHMRANIISIVLSIASTILQLGFPLCIQYLIDDIVMLRKWENLFMFSVLTVSVVIGKQLMGYFSCVLFADFSESAVADAREDLFGKIMKNKLSFFYKNDVGEIMTRITQDSQHVSSLLSYTIVEFSVNIIQIFVVFGILFSMNLLLAAITAVTVPIYMCLNKKFGGALQEQITYHRKNFAVLNNFYIESVNNIKHIKNFALESEIEQESNQKNEKMKKIQITTEKIGYRFHNLMKASIDINQVMVLALGGLFVANETLSLGALVAYMTYLGYVYEPFISLASLYTHVVETFVSLERFFEYFEDTENQEEYNEKGMNLGEIERISLKNVSFGYEEQKAIILKNVDLEIDKKDKICLLGKSGQGKSTLSSMLKLFYETVEGKILVNGLDIKEYSLKELRKGIFYLSQEAEFFDKSIRDNFHMINPNIVDGEIVSCLKKAQIYQELFDDTHEGLDTVLSKSGTNLSGGQRQRLQLAVLFADDSDMVILDEPFTGIDSINVAAIWEEMKKHLENKTVILIDHNFSDEKYFTRKVRLVDTRLMEEGEK